MIYGLRILVYPVLKLLDGVWGVAGISGVSGIYTSFAWGRCCLELELSSIDGITGGSGTDYICVRL